MNLIEHADLIERVNSPLYKGPAWWEPNTGILNPAKLSREWRRVLDGAGMPIYEKHAGAHDGHGCRPSASADPARDRHSEQGRACDECLDARISAAGDQTQVPVWTYIVLTEPLTDEQLDSIGWRGREGVEDFRDLVHYYRLTADNRLLIRGVMWGWETARDGFR